MRKFNWRRLRLRRVSPNQMTDSLLLINVYFTQGLTLLVAVVWFLFQRRAFESVFGSTLTWQILLWGTGTAAVVIAGNLILSRWVPENAMDDGGINERLFKNRPVWHIAVLSLVVAICEELLFRGVVQYVLGIYWTSLLFAILHVRYLRHWLPTGMVFGISYILGWIYVQSGSIIAPILAHFIYDLVMGLMIKYRRQE